MGSLSIFRTLSSKTMTNTTTDAAMVHIMNATFATSSDGSWEPRQNRPHSSKFFKVRDWFTAVSISAY